MGIDPLTGLAIAQFGVSAATGIASAINSSNAANSAKDAAARQTAATYREIQRQQIEVNRIAAEQTSDRVRAADAELGAARVAASERGVAGTTMAAMTRQIAYLEGADLSRIENNRVSNLAAGEASKASAKNGYLESVAIANNQHSVNLTSAILGTAGSGLRIAGNYYDTQATLAAAQNIRTG